MVQPQEAGICTEDLDVQAEIVNLHNALRSNVQPSAKNMLKMRYSAEVAASAQAWIDNCQLAHGPNTSRIIKGYELGENLHESTEIKTWTEVINAWYAERGRYTYPRGVTYPTGHYTQVVWFSSYEVGCGVKLCNDVYFYGCHYYRAYVKTIL
ncbi:cysteine-rich venom protein ophanin [Cheilinus undulatus]|uniref:cysteine-rich venom protein ophanin n=1 Tax=Cheilinus undulatus TaxID=241271 RepID=UPI001BD27945|nr:cysteine-rich venom protein ophanin [Cheilinus undulatus]